MNPHATDLYDVLGVERSVPSKSIKSAYARAVRQYPPERFPNEFRRIREAYETLGEAQSREEYDSTADPVVNGLVTKGQEALAEQDFEAAVTAFKRALVIRPTAIFLRHMLGLAFFGMENNRAALQQYERLTQEMPDNCAYWTHRGIAEENLELIEDAETSFRCAVDLDPQESGPQLGLARLLASQKRFLEAEQSLEDAIQADGVVDFDDFSFFFALLQIRLAEGDTNGIHEVVQRIEAVTREDWQKTRVAYRLAQLAQELLDAKLFSLALPIAERSHQLVPDDSVIEDLTKYIRSNHAIFEDWERLQHDGRVRESFKYVLAVVLQGYFDQWDNADDKVNAQKLAGTLVDRESATVDATGAQRGSLADELTYLEGSYANVARTLTDELKEIIRRGARTAILARLACPHCGHEAVAENVVSRFTCPNCSRSFDYDPSAGKASKWSGAVATTRGAHQFGGCIVQIGIYLALASLIGYCSQ